jgi:hypothetical protein
VKTSEKQLFDGTNVLTGRAWLMMYWCWVTVNLWGPTGGSNAGLTSDHVDSNDKAFTTSFPYLATAW